MPHIVLLLATLLFQCYHLKKIFVSNEKILIKRDGSLDFPFENLVEAFNFVSEFKSEIENEKLLEILIRPSDETKPYIINNEILSFKDNFHGLDTLRDIGTF
jgi:lipid II:glycine glycyltransferase (peptidoglycan interpeptide bridge formation enzyme)